MATTGAADQSLRISEEQHGLASALGRVGRDSLPHLEWEEMATHLALAWETSAVSSGLTWGLVESIVREAWEKASCAEVDDPQPEGMSSTEP